MNKYCAFLNNIKYNNILKLNFNKNLSSMHNSRLFPSFLKQSSKYWIEEGTTKFTAHDFIYPIFVSDKENEFEEIKGFPNQYRIGINKLNKYLEPLVNDGLKNILIFGSIDSSKKDIKGTHADLNSSPVISALKLIQKHFPQLFKICDICLCAYTSSGICGIIDKNHKIDIDLSIKRLAEICQNYVYEGCDCVAPSDMLDNRILAINNKLIECNQRNNVSIMSYSAKFSSSLYGPFRESCKSNYPGHKTRFNQLPIGSKNIAFRAIKRDIEQGADFIIIKPGIPYLDIISTAKNSFASDYPFIAYQVSGEYAMLYYGAQNNAFNLKNAIIESLVSFKRAGCSAIISYFTPQILKWI